MATGEEGGTILINKVKFQVLTAASMKMAVLGCCASEKSVNFYQTTRCNDLEDSRLNINHNEKRKWQQKYDRPFGLGVCFMLINFQGEFWVGKDILALRLFEDNWRTGASRLQHGVTCVGSCIVTATFCVY
jgi:hypothetical protein